MSFGRDIASGAGAQIVGLIVAALFIGGALALVGYFGISWLANNVSVTIK